MDIRLPIGLLFTGIGLLLILAGLITPAAHLKLATTGLNLDIVWGGAMTVFGIGAVILTRIGPRGGS
ncbi:hypothetical protein [Phenylobacterium aquaticum]|uniref:hypothetical protein n=1 Tax=Phenylobacterium aquaticum TaxID=1763816 RepID=UPI0026F0509E|nr:hypothetical protein [Phenylobacterium aquaticum]